MSSKQPQGLGVPYVNAYGNIKKVLEKIIEASTPERFTQDFLATKLDLKGGSATPLIPFLKRTGFLNGDGTPTDLYKEFRNETFRKAAAARAVKTGYSTLYEIREYAHDLNDKDLLGTVVQATGLEAGSTTAKAMVGSFKALRSFADFEIKEEKPAGNEELADLPPKIKPKTAGGMEQSVDLKLGYVINLNLPATSDVAVFNAIFKSLRAHLLD
jgi:hypothetical protein